MSTVYLALGSNIGDRHSYIKKALLQLSEIGTVQRVSSFVVTAPYGDVVQDDFVNAVCVLDTELLPQQLLIAIKNIEKSLDRTESVRWGPRTIDIDIILFDDMVAYFDNIKGMRLCIPHNDMHNRMFVLQPLMEIAPDVVHPCFGLSIKELYDVLLKEQ